MKTILNAIFCVCLMCVAALIQAQTVTLPRSASPAAELKQKIGITDITVNYSRPSVTLNGNDRSGKIWGQQVPYGFNKVGFGAGNPIPWRAGANENTVITFSDDVKFGGKKVKAGTYGLHVAVLEEDKATVILSKNHSSWGSFFYDEAEDILRADIQTEEISHREVLSYDFVELGNNYGVLALEWETKRFPIKIEVDVHETVLANARDELRSTAGFGWQGPLSIANYCMQNNINHEEAIQWADQSINNNKNFNNLFVKARLLQQTGNGQDAIAMMDEAAQLANTNQLNFMGYQMLGAQKYDKAIEYFKLNVQRNPKSANAHDSLGEAYKQKGEKKLAIKSLKKSLSLNPPANVKANSIKLLKELGVKYTEGS